MFIFHKNGIYISRILPILTVVFMLLFFTSCPQHEKFREIPATYVNFIVRPFSLDNDLHAIGNYKYFPAQGYNGIIVYHLSTSEFLAYDLACPNDYEYGCTIVYDPKTSTLIDRKCCGTTFNILSGFPEGSTLPSPLHSYKVTWINKEEIQVSN
ncbi:MAG: hypothetical protein RSA02_05000 [Bacteroidales bacterium]